MRGVVDVGGGGCTVRGWWVWGEGVHCEGMVSMGALCVRGRWVHSRVDMIVVIMRSWCTVRGVSGRMVHCEGEVDAGCGSEESESLGGECM